MTDELFRQDTDAGITTLTLNRPEKLNALSATLVRRLEQELDAIGQDPAVRIVILTGAGERAFAAGADIAEYRGGRHDAFNAYQFESRRVFDKLEALPKPTIAAINGNALGGGFEIALCCDVMIVSTSARLGLPEGRLGLSPGGGGPQRLIRSIGRHQTADLLLSAKRLTGERAYQIGLACDLCEPSNLLQMARQKAEAMIKLAPQAQAEMKRLLRLGADAPLPVALGLEQETLARLFLSADAQEGVAAFLDKRAPQFSGPVSNNP